MSEDSTIQEETKIQFVRLIFALMTVVGSQYLMTVMTTPDAWQRSKMRTFLIAKRVADKQQRFWSEIASKAATGYNRSKY